MVLIWGLNWSVSKRGLSYVGPFNLLLHRFALSTLVLFPLLASSWRKIPRDKNTLAKLLVLGVINSLNLAFTYSGMVYEDSGISSVLTFTQPLFVFCLAVLLLRGETTSNRFLGALVGFSGVLVISLGRLSSSVNFLRAIPPLLTGAFLWAVVTVYYKKTLTHVDPVVANAFQAVIGAAFVASWALAFEGLSFPLITEYIFLIVYTSIFGAGLALTLWMFLLAKEDATVLSSSSFIIPVAALLIGWSILGERVELAPLIGIALVITSVYLVNKS